MRTNKLGAEHGEECIEVCSRDMKVRLSLGSLIWGWTWVAVICMSFFWSQNSLYQRIGLDMERLSSGWHSKVDEVTRHVESRLDAQEQKLLGLPPKDIKENERRIDKLEDALRDLMRKTGNEGSN